MSTTLLGDHFDVHGGAVDNLFPHHENEIAQSEPLCGQPWVRYWMHPEHLDLKNEAGESIKMSKSLGNVISVPSLLEKQSPQEVRWFFASTHYRTKLAFTYELIASAAEGYKKINRLVRLLESKLASAPDDQLSPTSGGTYASLRKEPCPRDREHLIAGAYGDQSQRFIQRFIEGMNEDLGTPAGTAAIFDYANELYAAGIEHSEDVASVHSAYRCLVRHLHVPRHRVSQPAPVPGAGRRELPCSGHRLQHRALRAGDRSDARASSTCSKEQRFCKSGHDPHRPSGGWRCGRGHPKGPALEPRGAVMSQVFIVTGGTQGIGEGIALQLAEGGSTVVITGRNEARGAQVQAALEAKGSQALFVKGELSKEADCRAIVQAADDKFGRVDGLVNAAGVTDRGTIEDTTVELWDRIFNVNVRAPFILMQECVRRMKRDGRPGSIVNIISMSGHGGQPFLTPYSASKGALLTLTRNVANALRADRIRVNGITLGWTDTPGEHAIQKATGAQEGWLPSAEKAQPFGRLIKPHDVAKLSVYLLSEDSEMMTGSIIDFDQNVRGTYD